MIPGTLRNPAPTHMTFGVRFSGYVQPFQEDTRSRKPFPKDGSDGRAEIFVMGCRNPWRMSVDERTGFVYWGEVGPDAGGDTERGPVDMMNSIKPRPLATLAGLILSATTLHTPNMTLLPLKMDLATIRFSPSTTAPTTPGAKCFLRHNLR